MNIEKKYAPIQIKASNDEERIVHFIATDESIVDYDGEILKVDGLNFDKLMNGNKSFLWSHQHTQLPIGKIIEMKKLKSKVKGKAQMVSEEEYPFGHQIWKLIKGGYINNVSIGFLPTSDSEYKEVNGKRVRIIPTADVFEVSAVNVGANANAMITAVKSIKQACRRAWDDEVIDGKGLNDIEDMLLNMSIPNENTENEIKELKERLMVLEEKIHELTVEKELQDEEDNFIDGLITEFENIGESKDITTMNSNEDNYEAWLRKYYK